MTAQLRRGSGLIATLAILFFLSGVSALIYQVLWLRMLGWVFGVTVYAASSVWATFMAGLAVGSFAAGRLADRIRQPLRWFAAAEILIGITALGTPVMLRLLQEAYVAVYPSLPGSLAAVTAARLAIGFLVLIVPTALMGSTLPFVLKASVFQRGALAGQVGLLYGSNAAGAILGTLASGLSLIPSLGIQGTFYVAAACNVAVAAGALIMNARLGALAETGAQSAGVGHAAAPSAPPRGLAIVLAVFTLSGAVSMALEVVWFRVLTMIVRPTVYSFALMLATILGGIAIGSYGVAPLLGRRVRWVTVLAFLELALGLAIIVSFRPLAYLPLVSQRLGFLEHVMPAYLIYPLSGSLLTILPAALLMGTAFPIGLRVWAGGGDDAHTASRVGVFYSLNVAGAIVGSLVGGFVLLPQLGSQTSLTLIATASFLGGIALLWASDLRRPTQLAVGAVAIAAFVVCVRTLPDPYDQFIFQRYPTMDPIWKQEGTEATVGVHEFGDPGRRRRVMTINGNHQAGTDFPTTFTHRRIGHLPMLVHPEARRALVIGLGGGATPGAVSVHDGVEVDVVELAEAVVNGARLFEEINYGVVDRPNVKLRVDDGRNFMLLTKNRYDVVTADVIQPIFAGAGNIYSEEYFKLVRSVLKPDGVVMQWIPGTEAEFKLIGRTFMSVFPYTTAWGDGNLFIGSLQPLKLSRRAFDGRMWLPGRQTAMRDVRVESFEALLQLFVAGPDELRAYLGDGPLLTDDRPMAEYFLSLPRDRQPNLGELKRGDVSAYVVD